MEIGGPLLGILLAFTRVICFLSIVPLFQSRSVPSVVKVTVSLSVALFVHDKFVLDEMTMPMFVLLLLMQAVMGFALGYVVLVIFSIPQIAGGLLDLDMGFSSSSLIDPSSGQRVSVMANFYSVLFMLIFVMVGGLQSLLYGIVLSFHFTEAVMFTANPNFLETLLLVVQYMMVSAIQIALPIIATMFIVNILMLIIGKVAPQLNIMLNMFPIKIAVGLLFVYFTVTVAGEFFVSITENMNEHYLDVLESMFTK